MAIVTSHTLNSMDGTHAGAIAVTLIRLDADAPVLFATRMDAGGRLSEVVDLIGADPNTTYQLVFDTGPYWTERLMPARTCGIIDQIVLRFQMSDPDGDYHWPIILSPNGYSTWMSRLPSTLA